MRRARRARAARRRARALARRRPAPAAADGRAADAEAKGYALAVRAARSRGRGARRAASARPTAPRKLMLTVRYRMHPEIRASPRRGSTTASSRARRACSGARAQRGDAPATAPRRLAPLVLFDLARRPVRVARNVGTSFRSAASAPLPSGACVGDEAEAPLPLRRASYPTRCALHAWCSARARAPAETEEEDGDAPAEAAAGAPPPRKHARRGPGCLTAPSSPVPAAARMLSACLRDAGLTVERADRDARGARARRGRAGPGATSDDRTADDAQGQRAGESGLDRGRIPGTRGRRRFRSTVRSARRRHQLRGRAAHERRSRAAVASRSGRRRGDAGARFGGLGGLCAHTDARVDACVCRLAAPSPTRCAQALRSAPRWRSQRPRPDSGPAAMGANSAMAAPVAACPAKRTRPTGRQQRVRPAAPRQLEWRSAACADGPTQQGIPKARK